MIELMSQTRLSVFKYILCFSIFKVFHFLKIKHFFCQPKTGNGSGVSQKVTSLVEHHMGIIYLYHLLVT